MKKNSYFKNYDKISKNIKLKGLHKIISYRIKKKRHNRTI